MRKPPVDGNGVAVALGDSKRARIGPAFKQRQSLGLHSQILTVQPWHQPELAAGSAGFRGDPVLLLRSKAQLQSLRIPRKGAGGIPPDVARELIQEQHQRQACRW